MTKKSTVKSLADKENQARLRLKRSYRAYLIVSRDNRDDEELLKIKFQELEKSLWDHRNCLMDLEVAKSKEKATN